MARQAIIKTADGRLHIQNYNTPPNALQTYENSGDAPNKLSFSGAHLVGTFSSNANPSGSPYLDIKIASSAIIIYYSKDTVVFNADNTVVIDTSDGAKTFEDFDAAMREFLGQGTFPPIPQ